MKYDEKAFDEMLNKMTTPAETNCKQEKENPKDKSKGKEKDKDKELHKGHRERLNGVVEKAGLEKMTKIQAVENFLFYILPRGDTNPLAHDLLDFYGNFPNIVDASISDLMKVKGINRRAATKIKQFHDYMDYYCFCRSQGKVYLKNQQDFVKFMKELMKFKNTENMYLLAINNSYRLILMRHLDMQQVRTVGIDPMDIYDFINSTHAVFLAVIHNHPGGTAQPTPEDHRAAKFIDSLLENVECRFVDSFIIGEDGITSEKQEGFIEYFDTNDNLIDFFN